jgi:hypothetical protein
MEEAASKENQDLNAIKIDELISSLQAFKKSLDKRRPVRKHQVLIFALKERWRTNVPDKTSNIRPHGKSKEDSSFEQDKGVKCYEYEGFGHIRPECPNFKKKTEEGNDNHIIQF